MGHLTKSSLTSYGEAPGKLVQWILGKLATGKLLTCYGLVMGMSPTCYRLATYLLFMNRLVSDTTGKSLACYGLAI